MEFNQAPYFDDFDEDKQYYSVLFKAGNSVQARELNVLQSMKQYQIGALGNHLFKNGAKISGCTSSFVQYDYARIIDLENKIESFNTSYKVVGKDTKVEATIVQSHNMNSYDDALVLLMYTKSGVNQEQTFAPGEFLYIYNNKDEHVYTINVMEQLPTDEIPVLGKSLVFIIDEGVFYYNSYFIKVHKQSLLVDRYLTKDENGNIVSDNYYRVGLDVVEDIITSDEDKSLLDPHFGAPNFGAPGADRYKINMYLSMRDYVEDGTTTNFITLAKVRQNHAVEYQKDETEYGDIMKELSRRTYETYGDFTVVPWKAHFLNEKKIDAEDTKGWSLNGDKDKYVAIVSPGSGYVKGYRVATQNDVVVRGRKAIDIGTLTTSRSTINEPNYVIVDSTGVCDWGYINPSSPNQNTFKFNMYNAANTLIGTFHAYDIYKLPNNKYKVYLYGMSLNGKDKVASTVRIKLTNGQFDATCPYDTFKDVLSYHNSSLLIPLGTKDVTRIGNVTMNLRTRFNAVLDGTGNYTFILDGNSRFVEDPNTIAWVQVGSTLSNIDAANLNITDTALIVTLGESFAAGTVTIMTTVKRDDITPRKKTKTTTSVSVNGSEAVSKAGWIKTLKVDTIRIDSVTISGGPGTSEIDITNEYTLVQGTDNHNFYSSASIKRNTFRNINPEDVIKITYTYFEHGIDGEYFTINSYDEEDLVDIPLYKGLKASDYLDFRVRTDDKVSYYYSGIPAVNSPVSFDIQYYMSRADLLVIDTSGELKIKEGTPGKVAKLPVPDEDTMPLYGIFLDSLGSVTDIRTTYYDNKPYKTKDLTRLKNRIEKIEDAVTMTLLEQQTLNMSVKDQNGLDRYKNGIIVDNFKTFNAADIAHPEFKAALDTNKGILRPQFKQNNLRLAFEIARSENIINKGNMAIKKYEHDLFIQNANATQSVSINPYFIFCKNGNMSISPNIDTWAEDQYLPNLVMNVDTGVEALREVADAAKLTGTKYGSWADFNTSIVTDVKTTVSAATPVIESTKSYSSSNAVITETTKTKVTTTTDIVKSTTVESAREVESTYVGQQTQTYNINDMVKDVSIIPYIRSKTIQFYATNLKPNTRVYAFFEGVDVNIHCRKLTQLKDGGDVLKNRNASMFGTSELIVDGNGTLSGEFRIPANTFFTGEKVFVLTDDPSNTGNMDMETTRCQATYFAGGVSQTKQNAQMNVITPTYGTVVSNETKSSTTVSRDQNVITNTITSVSSKVVEEELIDISESDLKAFFFANHPRNTPVCSYYYANVAMNNISWWGGANNTEEEITIMRLLAIKERIEQQEAAARTQSNNAQMYIRQEWELYELQINKAKSYERGLEELLRKLYKEIRTNFNRAMSQCQPVYDKWVGDKDYGFFKDTWNSEWEAKASKLINSLSNDVVRGKSSTLRYNNRAWIYTPPRPVDSSKYATDPVAQGFKVEESCFISKVEVYFAAVDDKADVIWFEIRELVNGYPSNEGIAHTEIRGADLKKYESADGKTPYPVEFDIPIYVDASKSYAFVVGGYSPDTRVYMSKLGEKLLNSDKILEQPPLPYTMFRSLNGDTWNAEQFDTMKINIYRCVFDMSPTVVMFRNSNEEQFEIPVQYNPIETQKNNNRVRIYANNHNLRVNDRVILNFGKGLYYEITVTNGGIPQIGQPISTLTGSGYIKDVKTTTSLNVYEIMVDRMVGSFKVGQEFTCETRKYEYRDLFLASDKGAGGTPITMNVVLGNIKTVSKDIPTEIAGAEISLFAKEHIVREVDTIDSFIIEIESPFNSAGRFGIDCINILGNNIKYDVFNVAGQYLGYGSKESWILTGHPFEGTDINDVSFTPMADITLEDPQVILSSQNEPRIKGKGEYSFNIYGKFTPPNPYISPVFNTDSFSVTTVSNRIDHFDESTYNVAPNSGGRYIDETDASRGAQPFKYVTTKVMLENAASDIRVMFDIHLPNKADFDVYIKITRPGEQAPEEKLSWIKIDNFEKKNTGNKLTDYMSYDLTASKHCNSWSSAIEFIAFRVKLVGRSPNSSMPVLFQNLRAIAVT